MQELSRDEVKNLFDKLGLAIDLIDECASANENEFDYDWTNDKDEHSSRLGVLLTENKVQKARGNSSLFTDRQIRIIEEGRKAALLLELNSPEGYDAGDLSRIGG